ncbi:hypothetical protein [Tropicibacter oceani]|uniref:DUF2125 domain-containing protein n=1 Tax=Tropicibacter oceani TaxID=3058420 RepID=A0ABY8QK79_9RHOB|nr:hypothetical protein [Tropicibacter oceani]WGW05017.1 hypothetical protein QF118_05560 [Tropicibacter oceani]
MKPTTAALAVLALSVGAKAGAADQAALFALRDALAPGECTMTQGLTSQPFGDGVLHRVPCRMGFADQLSVMILERGGALVPLLFTEPTFDFDYGPDDQIDWAHPRIGDVFSSALISSAQVQPMTGTIESSTRIAPGVGEGAFVYRYEISEWGAVLTEAALVLDSGQQIALWPPRPPSILDELGLAHDLQGFEAQQTPDWTLPDPGGIVALLALGFPSQDQAEGRPRLLLEMAQEGTRIAANVLETGWADDSVAGQVFRVLLEQAGDGWVVTGLGRATVCWRGSPRVTTGACP